MQQTLDEASWPADRVDQVVMGNVAPPADATNPARVAAVQAGIPVDVPALTVQRNCASGMEALAQAEMLLSARRCRIVLAGGAESMSTIPLLFPASAMEPFGRLARAQGLTQKLAALASFRPRHFAPVIGLKQGLTDPLVDMIMGQNGEVLAHEFGITRLAQDEFALRSHMRACASAAAGVFNEQIAPMYVGPTFKPVTEDIGPRKEQTLAALAKLKPIFDRKDGSVTVGNSCQVTDGAAMLLVADADFADAEGLKPVAFIRGYATAALDPARMGLGPVFAIAQLLDAAGMTLGDIGLFEINEAFAAQVLACLVALDSDTFAQKHLNREHRIGAINPEILNIDGGAIALGHPVGATGARITLNLMHAMKRRGVEWGIASLCVGGGQGAAVLLQLA
jgi:acetyl-CoA C-acetyltransferase/acetyl-CoA acyltransferase